MNDEFIKAFNKACRSCHIPSHVHGLLTDDFDLDEDEHEYINSEEAIAEAVRLANSKQQDAPVKQGTLTVYFHSILTIDSLCRRGVGQRGRRRA